MYSTKLEEEEYVQLAGVVEDSKIRSLLRNKINDFVCKMCNTIKKIEGCTSNIKNFTL